MLPFIHLGQITFALYGLCVALGCVVAYQLSVANARRLHSPASAGRMLASLFIIVVWGGCVRSCIWWSVIPSSSCTIRRTS